MKRFVSIFALLIVVLYGNTYAQDRVRVPRGKAILIDGKFPLVNGRTVQK
jgi:hypothetical protein